LQIHFEHSIVCFIYHIKNHHHLGYKRDYGVHSQAGLDFVAHFFTFAQVLAFVFSVAALIAKYGGKVEQATYNAEDSGRNGGNEGGENVLKVNRV
jgi:hypothetical protein